MEIVDALILDDTRETKDLKKPLLALGYTVGTHQSFRQIGARFRYYGKDPDQKPQVIFVDLNWDDVPFDDFSLLGEPDQPVPSNPFEFGMAIIKQVIQNHPVLKHIPIICFSSVTEEPKEQIHALRKKNVKIAFISKDEFCGAPSDPSRLADLLNKLGVKIPDPNPTDLRSEAEVNLDSCLKSLNFASELFGERPERFVRLVFGMGFRKSPASLDKPVDATTLARVQVVLGLARYFVAFYQKDSVPSRYAEVSFSPGVPAFKQLVRQSDWAAFENAVNAMREEVSR